MPVEKPSKKTIDSQIELFDVNDEPTAESQTSDTTEVSPAEEFSKLTGGQVPGNYGLNTDEKIRQFMKDNQGQSRMNISLALIALSKEQDAENQPEYSWQKRSDLR